MSGSPATEGQFRIAVITASLEPGGPRGSTGREAAELSRLLAERGHRVLVVLGSGPGPATGEIHRLGREMGVELADGSILAQQADGIELPDSSWDRTSRRIARYLAQRELDLIVSFVGAGVGFRTAQLRRTGELVAPIVAVVDSVSAACRERARLWRTSDLPAIEQGLLDFAERATAEESDLAVFTDEALFDWCSGHGWEFRRLERRFAASEPRVSDEGAASRISASIAAMEDAAAIRPQSLGREDQPMISVCVPHFNHGAFVEETLAALARQTASNFEVIVVDDGSTDLASTSELNRLEGIYAPDSRFRFYRRKNSYVGATRNFAARQARGELLVFVDADNVPYDDMLDRMRNALFASDAAVLTIGLEHFGSDTERAVWLPHGSANTIGWARNIYGDTNFIIRKGVFAELAGFSEARGPATEDWDLLARLSLRGYRLAVLPVPLLRYRHVPNSLISTTSAYLNRALIARTFEGALPSPLKGLFEGVLLAALDGGLDEGRGVSAARMARYRAFDGFVGQLLPDGSRRRAVVKRIAGSLDALLRHVGRLVRHRTTRRR